MVTLSACWVKSSAYAYDYTGGEQTFTAPCNGYYKLEVWGAQGGGATHPEGTNARGGYGGYSIGVAQVTKSDTLHVYIGQNPATSTQKNTAYVGGYNGGGDSTKRHDLAANSGGGATHIAKTSGLLRDLSSNRNAILIVAGGGGGNSIAYYSEAVHVARAGVGGNGGGYIGGNGSYGTPVNCESYGHGGTQSEGGSYTVHPNHAFRDILNIPTAGFGYGSKGDIYDPTESIYDNDGGAGGGGGWYGGRGNSCIGGAGGGSGYIGSSNLISGGGITKHMTCYSCTTSIAASTRTNSNTNVSGTATADYSKTGNGYAKITYLGPTI